DHACPVNVKTWFVTVRHHADPAQLRLASNRKTRETEALPWSCRRRKRLLTDIDLPTLIGGLSRATHSLAALGAALRLRQRGERAPPEVQAPLDDVLAALGVASLADLDAGQCTRLADLCTLHLRHAMELFENPGRPAGWNHTDPALLEAQGRASHL